MNVRSACLGGVLWIAAVGTFVPARASGEEKPNATAPDLSGRWQLNKDLSGEEQPYVPPTSATRAGQGATAVADAGAAGRGGDRHGGAGGRGRTMPLPAPSGVDDDPRGGQRTAPPGDVMTITGTGTEIVVEQPPGQPRAFYPNGKTYKADDGASDVKSRWSAGTLVVEKKSVHGWKLSETWQLAPDRRRLTVGQRLEGGSRPRTVTRRVYDRVDP